MIDTNQTISVSTSFAGQVAAHLSWETRELLALGRECGWDCAVLGQGPLPDETVRLGDWLVVPPHQDTSQVPARALQRVQAIFAAGLRPQGFVIVHEAPDKMLPALTQQLPNPSRMSVLSPRIKSGMKVAAGGLSLFALGLVMVAGLAIVALVLATIAAALFLPVALVVGAITLDPILVAVTEDGYWIEIDRWDV